MPAAPHTGELNRGHNRVGIQLNFNKAALWGIWVECEIRIHQDVLN